MNLPTQPPREPRPGYILMCVTEMRIRTGSYLGSMNARTTMDVIGMQIRNGRNVGAASVQMTGTRIKGIVAKGHWLEIPRSAVDSTGRTNYLRNLSTGQDVRSSYHFLDWFH